MRKKIVAGNWKMNKSFNEAIDLIQQLKNLSTTFLGNCEVIVIPPFPYLKTIADNCNETSIKIGAQNCSEYNSGAYTGEVAAAMLQSVGCSYALVGHSERRQYFKESDAQLSKKLNGLLNQNITPIYCVGEQLEQRKNGHYFEKIKQQIENVAFLLSEEEFSKIVVAYEPVWAIGTGETATSKQAQEIHLFIRNLVAKKYSKTIANNLTILYGGSCNPKNAKELFSCLDVDGGLIGGASLKATDFTAIINSF